MDERCWTKTHGRRDSARKNSSAEEVEVFLAEGSLDHPPLNPLSLHQDSVHQITKSPSQLNCSRFSPHAFHLDEKVEVFVAEGSQETLPLLPAPPPPVQEITNPHELRISTFWSSFTCPPSPLSSSSTSPTPPLPSTVLCGWVVGWWFGGWV